MQPGRNGNWFRSLQVLDDQTVFPLGTGDTRSMQMRSFWDETSVLGPIYRLVGEGVNDEGIALQLGLTEVKVRGCITWIVHFFELKSRRDLVRYASTAV